MDLNIFFFKSKEKKEMSFLKDYSLNFLYDVTSKKKKLNKLTISPLSRKNMYILKTKK